MKKGERETVLWLFYKALPFFLTSHKVMGKTLRHFLWEAKSQVTFAIVQAEVCPPPMGYTVLYSFSVPERKTTRECSFPDGNCASPLRSNFLCILVERKRRPSPQNDRSKEKTSFFLFLSSAYPLLPEETSCLMGSLGFCDATVKRGNHKSSGQEKEKELAKVAKLFYMIQWWGRSGKKKKEKS